MRSGMTATAPPRRSAPAVGWIVFFAAVLIGGVAWTVWRRSTVEERRQKEEVAAAKPRAVGQLMAQLKKGQPDPEAMQKIAKELNLPAFDPVLLASAMQQMKGGEIDPQLLEQLMSSAQTTTFATTTSRDAIVPGEYWTVSGRLIDASNSTSVGGGKLVFYGPDTIRASVDGLGRFAVRLPELNEGGYVIGIEPPQGYSSRINAGGGGEFGLPQVNSDETDLEITVFPRGGERGAPAAMPGPLVEEESEESYAEGEATDEELR